MALVLKPFMALPPTAGAVTWLLLKAAMAAVMFVWAVRLATEPCSARSASGNQGPLAERAEHFPPLAALFVGLLALHPILGDLQHGNVNIFIAFLAYCLHVTLKRRLAALAPGLTPRSVLEKFAAVQMIDVVVPTTDGRELQLTRTTQPDFDLKLLLEKLKLELPEQPPPRISVPSPPAPAPARA